MSFRADDKVRYNSKVPERRPREIPEHRRSDLFGKLGSNRDRMLLTLSISGDARAAEVLGVRGVALDWGDKQVRVIRKGTQAEQWLPASKEAFVCIRLYLADLCNPLTPNEPAVVDPAPPGPRGRSQRQPTNYEAFRAVFRRGQLSAGSELDGAGPAARCPCSVAVWPCRQRPHGNLAGSPRIRNSLSRSSGTFGCSASSTPTFCIDQLRPSRRSDVIEVIEH